jgi:hypothetical protein
MVNKRKRLGMLSTRRTRLLISRALKSEVRPSNLDPEALTGVRRSLVRSLPEWVWRFGLLAGSDNYCLWCEPRSSPGETFPSQMILDAPRGRYLIDVFDVETQEWVSRESAEGGPLVAGLPCTGNPLLVWIHKGTT